MLVENRLKIAIARRKADVFLRTDFARLSSEAQLSRALRNLIDAGVIVKLGVGVYAKAKRSVLSGAPIPVKPVEVLAEQALDRLAVKVFPSRLASEYNAGRTTQMPAGTVINTGNRRIVRKLGFGNKTIRYENNNRRPAGTH